MKKKLNKNYIRCLLICMCFFGIPFSVSAESINLPKDSEGWTIFTPSADSNIIYVSNSGNDETCQAYLPSSPEIGADPFEPSGEILPCATYTAAYAKMRSGHPDWVLLKRGDVFYESFVYFQRNGRSATEPIMVASYGESGPPPILKTGAATQGVKIGFKNYVVLSGLEFYAHTRDLNGSEYVDSTGGIFGLSISGSPDVYMHAILVEGCKFRFYVNNGVTGYDNADGITLRRNVFLDNYSHNQGHSQGLLAGGVSGSMVLEENIFDHNGWYSQAGSGEIGPATWFNHNIYLGGDNVMVRDNMSLRSSSIGIKFANYEERIRESTIIDNNLIVDGEVAISIWGEAANQGKYEYLAVTNNILTNIGRSRPTNRNLAWNIDISDVSSGVVENNIVMNQVNPNLGGFGIRPREHFKNVSISNNILYNLLNTEMLDLPSSVNYPAHLEGVTFNRNIFETESIGTHYNVRADYAPLGSITFAANKYFSDKPDGQRYRVMSTNKTDAQWALETGDNSTFEQASFSDPTRSIETYMASLGETPTIDAFISKARAQNRYSWDSRYTTEAVNSWIRAGFVTAEFRADVDGSSQITTTDALLTLRNSLELSMTGTVWRASSTTGDVNCDGVSNSTDALLILRHSLGLSMSGTSWCE